MKKKNLYYEMSAHKGAHTGISMKNIRYKKFKRRNPNDILDMNFEKKKEEKKKKNTNTFIQLHKSHNH